MTRTPRFPAPAALVLLSLLALVPAAHAQQQDCDWDEANRMVMPGLGGRPSLVKDDLPCRWFEPIPVYADPDIELFLTSYVADEGWATWYGHPYYDKKRQFYVVLYSYYPTAKDCLAQLRFKHLENDPALLRTCSVLRYQQRHILIDLKARTVTVLDYFVGGADGRIALVKDREPGPVTYPLDGPVPSGSDPRAVHLLRQAVARILPVLEKQLFLYPAQQ